MYIKLYVFIDDIFLQIHRQIILVSIHKIINYKLNTYFKMDVYKNQLIIYYDIKAYALI